MIGAKGPASAYIIQQKLTWCDLFDERDSRGIGQAASLPNEKLG